MTAFAEGAGIEPDELVDDLYRTIWAAAEAAWALHFDMPWRATMSARAVSGFRRLAVG